MTEPTEAGACFTSVCITCGRPITTATRQEVQAGLPRWRHVTEGASDAHSPEPELRFAIDALCPGCQFPAVGYGPARAEYACSRCGWTGTERPIDGQEISRQVATRSADPAWAEECAARDTEWWKDQSA